MPGPAASLAVLIGVGSGVAESAKKRCHALIVDDHEPTRLLIARILEQDLDLQVSLAATCEVALRVADKQLFDVILLDLLMPGIGGFDLLKLIRSESANIETPVVVVSVLDDQDSIDRCMALKAHAFVTKPLNRATLTAIVKAQLPRQP
jgi:DNA-binding response OmpR family regulator